MWLTNIFNLHKDEIDAHLQQSRSLIRVIHIDLSIEFVCNLLVQIAFGVNHHKTLFFFDSG